MNRSVEVVAEPAAPAAVERTRQYVITDGTFPFTAEVKDLETEQIAYGLFDRDGRAVVVVRHEGEKRIDVHETDVVVSWAREGDRSAAGLIVRLDRDPQFESQPR
jgi:hypothetical protein